MRTAAAFVQREFIGLKAKVIRSTSSLNVGISGTVVDETRNMIVIRHKGEDKAIVKETSVFEFTLPDATKVEIEGRAILGRPEDRVKKTLKRQW
jgi:ribonuclease P protein subunit POP4